LPGLRLTPADCCVSAVAAVPTCACISVAIVVAPQLFWMGPYLEMHDTVPSSRRKLSGDN
jgi:hypothetical protein